MEGRFREEERRDVIITEGRLGRAARSPPAPLASFCTICSRACIRRSPCKCNTVLISLAGAILGHACVLVWLPCVRLGTFPS